MAYADVVLADSPVGYWRLGEASGLPQDSSGNGNHATSVEGTLVYGTTGALYGDSDDAVEFSGAEEIVIPHHAALDFGLVCSVEVWVKMKSVTPPQVVCIKGFVPDPPLPGFALRLQVLSGEAVLNYVGFDGVFVSKEANAAIPLDVGRWTHVVVSQDADSVDLYLDGCNATLIPEGLPTPVSGDGLVYVGHSEPLTDLGHADAFMDEFAIYDTKLSSAQVAAHYEAAIDPAILDVEGEGPSAISAGM